MLTGEKSQFSSTTIRAIIVAMITLIGSFGVKYILTDPQIEAVTEGVLAAASLVSMAVAWWGRRKAKSRIATSDSDEHVHGRSNPYSRRIPSICPLVPLAPLGSMGPLGALIIAGMMGAVGLGCSPATSPSYQHTVHKLYPTVAERITTLATSPSHPNHEPDFRLPPHRQQLVDSLIRASSPGDPSQVSYDTARPAWEQASEYYRSLVRTAPPSLLHPFRQQNWLDTADILDDAQAAEAEYQAIRAQPLIPPIGPHPRPDPSPSP